MSIKSSVREAIPRGLWRALHGLREEVNTYRKHRTGLRGAKRYTARRDLKLNIGCGPNYKRGWVNIDLEGTPDLFLDMRERLPFADSSVEFIYSEHFFEHLDFPDDTRRFLSESYRVLKSAGTFRVCVPETSWPLRDYVGVGDGSWLAACERGEWIRPAWCKTKLDHVNYHFRQDGEHRYAYDFETLKAALSEAGFDNISQAAFDPKMDDLSRHLGSLYVECVKPTVTDGRR
jgi:SAM-dependent methyltransferase